MRKWILLGVALVMCVVLLPAGCTLLIASVVGTSSAQASCGVPDGGTIAPGDVQIKGKPINAEQSKIAATIISIGRSRGFSERDIKVALMVAIQESSMLNLDHGDRDSLGVFQQRSSWGTTAQRLDPSYAANKFYDAMATIHDRENIPLLDLALAIQRPSRAAYLSPANYFPGADREQAAEQLLGLYGRTKSARVFVLGDSIALGSEGAIQSSFRSAGYSEVVVNGSVSRSISRPGITSGQRTSGFDALDVEAVKKQVSGSAVVVVELGTNGDGSPDEFRTKLSSLLDKIRGINPETSIFVVNIFSPAVSSRQEYNSVITNLAGGKKYTVINADGKTIPTVDKIHPTVDGQKVLANAIVGTVTTAVNTTTQADYQGCMDSTQSSYGSLNGQVITVSTTGTLVPVPGFPGATVDDRILPNLMAIMQQYKVKIGDCYATSGHKGGGEHPLGLACDFYPDTSKGGNWDLVDQLAAWAEPSQNNPRPPFRWVGYNGDENHGRGNHLHLSWKHGPATPNTRAPWVNVIQGTSQTVAFTDPGEGPPGFDGLVPRAQSLRQFVLAYWGCQKLGRDPCVKEIGGYRNWLGGKDPRDHSLGLAIDIVISTRLKQMPTADQQAFGWGMACYFQQNAKALGIQYAIWQNLIWNVSRASEGGPGRCSNVSTGWRPYGKSGITEGHYDHIHVTVAPGPP